MSNILTNITRKVGDYIASKTKDADNELFTEISETVIDEFINEIKKDNPVLASWVEDWKKKKMDMPVKKAKKTSSIYNDEDDEDDRYGGCGFTPTYKSNDGGRGSSSGGWGSSSIIYYRGGC